MAEHVLTYCCKIHNTQCYKLLLLTLLRHLWVLHSFMADMKPLFQIQIDFPSRTLQLLLLNRNATELVAK